MPKIVIRFLILIFIGAATLAWFSSQAQAPQVYPLQNGDLINGPDGIDVFIIQGQHKRHIPNPEIFNSYEHLKWENIKPVSDRDLSSFKTSYLVRLDGDYKVYVLWPNQTKHWLNIDEKSFEKLGYNWNQIFKINAQEYELYKTGLEIIKADLAGINASKIVISVDAPAPLDDSGFKKSRIKAYLFNSASRSVMLGGNLKTFVASGVDNIEEFTMTDEKNGYYSANVWAHGKTLSKIQTVVTDNPSIKSETSEIFFNNPYFDFTAFFSAKNNDTEPTLTRALENIKKTLGNLIFGALEDNSPGTGYDVCLKFWRDPEEGPGDEEINACAQETERIFQENSAQYNGSSVRFNAVINDLATCQLDTNNDGQFDIPTIREEITSRGNEPYSLDQIKIIDYQPNEVANLGNFKKEGCINIYLTPSLSSGNEGEYLPPYKPGGFYGAYDEKQGLTLGKGVNVPIIYDRSLPSSQRDFKEKLNNIEQSTAYKWATETLYNTKMDELMATKRDFFENVDKYAQEAGQYARLEARRRTTNAIYDVYKESGLAFNEQNLPDDKLNRTRVCSGITHELGHYFGGLPDDPHIAGKLALYDGRNPENNLMSYNNKQGTKLTPYQWQMIEKGLKMSKENGILYPTSENKVLLANSTIEQKPYVPVTKCLIENAGPVGGCGGRTESPFGIGPTFLTPTCGKCDKACGIYAYLWDENTKICGCGL